jgi:hypothetical protein
MPKDLEQSPLSLSFSLSLSLSLLQARKPLSVNGSGQQRPWHTFTFTFHHAEKRFYKALAKRTAPFLTQIIQARIKKLTFSPERKRESACTSTPATEGVSQRSNGFRRQSVFCSAGENSKTTSFYCAFWKEHISSVKDAYYCLSLFRQIFYFPLKDWNLDLGEFYFGPYMHRPISFCIEPRSSSCRSRALTYSERSRLLSMLCRPRAMISNILIPRPPTRLRRVIGTWR